MRFIGFILALIFSTLCAAPATASDQNDPLVDWRWNKRLLVWCQPNAVAIDMGKASTVLKEMNWDGFSERDLVFVELRKNTIHSISTDNFQTKTVRWDGRVQILIHGSDANSKQKHEKKVEGSFMTVRSGDNELALLLRHPYTDQDQELRNLVSCHRDDEFVLIGKDGSVKRVWQNLVPMDELFATIDAMPMRQREMREQSE